MRIGDVLLSYVLLGTSGPAIAHFCAHGQFNAIQISLSFFCTLNILISFWEIALGMYINEIQRDYLILREKFKGSGLRAAINFFSTPMKFSEIFKFQSWTSVWATYSLYDPSYSNRESFGFFIDVGNGWSTLIPSAVFLYGLTYDIIRPRALGILGALMFYQEFYGTVIYFSSFLFNKRYRDKAHLEVALFVGLSNGMWFFFPLMGLWVSIVLILENNFKMVR